MKKIAVVKKQLNKLGYKMECYAKTGKASSLYFGKIGNYKQKLEVVLDYEGEHVIYTPIGLCNYEFISSLKNLKNAVYKIEEKL